VVEGSENKENKTYAIGVDKGGRPVDPRRVTKGRNGFGKEEVGELGDFKIGATMKRWGFPKCG
jgi:hypothetical protein